VAKASVEIPLNGYPPNQTDFGTYLTAFPNALTVLESEVVVPSVNAEQFSTTSTFCSIVIFGHADRVDIPGLSSEARRAQELEASVKRADSAASWLFDRISDGLALAGLTPPQIWADLERVDVVVAACGAANLEVLQPVSESDRLKNRRVQVFVTVFSP
jgi:flagellar motor protein MotB